MSRAYIIIIVVIVIIIIVIVIVIVIVVVVCSVHDVFAGVDDSDIAPTYLLATPTRLRSSFDGGVHRESVSPDQHVKHDTFANGRRHVITR
jgi:hypothetical protein